MNPARYQKFIWLPVSLRIFLDEPITPALKNSPQANAAFSTVGIGASAGGWAALEAFFSGMPANVDLRMAFVLVQHLALDLKSILKELIHRGEIVAIDGDA